MAQIYHTMLFHASHYSDFGYISLAKFLIFLRFWVKILMKAYSLRMYSESVKYKTKVDSIKIRWYSITNLTPKYCIEVKDTVTDKERLYFSCIFFRMRLFLSDEKGEH